MSNVPQMNRVPALLVLGLIFSLGGLYLCASKSKPHVFHDGEAPVFFARESLTVFGNDKFPQDLACELHVGPGFHPYFRTKGESSRVTFASIDISPEASVSVVRGRGGSNAFVLYLFYEDSEGKVVSIFDLNVDGAWDIKKTTRRGKRNLIRYDGEWLEVDKIVDIPSGTPRAVKNETQYEFVDTWKRTK